MLPVGVTVATAVIMKTTVIVTVQPNVVTIETGLLLGLKARVNATQGASPGSDRPQKKLLGL